MNSSNPAYVPPVVRAHLRDGLEPDWCGEFRAMASDIRLRLPPGAADPDRALDEVEQVFRSVESQCTRFDPQSDLMRANDAADEWHRVGRYCFEAITAAAAAHLATRGLFDPRVLRALCELGYDRSVAFGVESDELGPRRAAYAVPDAPWLPALDAEGSRVRIGPHPVELGGIGKGLAVRWAAEKLHASHRSFVLDAGGDCYLSGDRAGGTGWNVGVEDPAGGEMPAAVLTVRDAACATSSIRLRRWTNGGRPAHHLIDPRTGAPGGAGLLSVTVVDKDPATAEVWSKVLFLHGLSGISQVAAAQGRAALWIGDDGVVGASAAMEQHVIWRAR